MELAVKEKNFMKFMNVRIDDELRDQLNQYVEKYAADRSKVIKKALNEFLDKNLQPESRKLAS